MRKTKFLTFEQVQSAREHYNIELYKLKFINLQQEIDSFIDNINTEVRKEVASLKYLKANENHYQKVDLKFKVGETTFHLQHMGFDVKKIDYLVKDNVSADMVISDANKALLYALSDDLIRIQHDYQKVKTLWNQLDHDLKGKIPTVKAWLTLFPECKVMGWEVEPYKKYKSEFNKSYLSKITGIDPIVVKEYITQASMEGVL